MGKNLLVGALLFSLALGTFGAGKTESAAPAGAPIPVSFWYSIGGNIKDTTEEIIKNYNESQKKYKIEALFAGTYEDSVKKIVAAVVSGDSPVLLHQAHVYAPQLISAGALQELNDFIDKDKSFERSQFVDTLFNANVKEGKVFGLPFNCSTPLIYYNKDMFRKAGLDPEKFPTTWDEFYTLVKKLKGIDKDVVGASIDYGSGWILQGLAWQWGAEWIAKDNSQVPWNEPNHVAAVVFFKKLIDEKIAVFKGGRAAFLGGKNFAIFFESTSALAALKTQAQFDLGVAIYPVQARKMVPLGGGSLYMFKGKSAAAQAGAWDFMKFMTSKDNQAFWSEKTGYLAARNDTKAALSEKLFKADPRYTTAYLQVGYSRPENDTWYPHLLNLRTLYNETWDKIMLQGLDPKAAMDEATRKGNQIIKDAR